MFYFFKNIISVIFCIFKFSLIKLYRRNNFKFHWLERFSPNSHLDFIGNGEIRLGKAVRAHSNVRLRVVNGGKIFIGDNVSINYNCFFVSMEKIQIEEGVEFGPNVLIYDHDHDFMVEGGIKKKKFTTQPVFIGENTWVGANTIILKGTRIGKNCVIGAGSIIKGNIPDNTLVIQKRNSIFKEIK